MPAFTVPYKSFAGGEISPDINARTDQVKYQTGLGLCRNWFTRLEGSASNRSGTAFVCPLTRFSAGPGRMLPFVFSDDQSYELLLHWDGVAAVKFLVIKQGAPIMLAPLTITGVTSANPPVVTSVAHGLAAGALVYVEGVQGTTEVNDRWFQVANPTADTFELWEEAAVDGSAYGTFSGIDLGTVTAAYVQTVSALTAARLATLRYSQSGDVLTITHDEVPPFKITRVAEDNWTVGNITFAPSISRPFDGALTGTAGAVTTRYRVTAVQTDSNEESFAGYMASYTATLDLLGTNSPWRVTKAGHGHATGDEVVVFASPGPASGHTYVITVTGVNTYTLDGTNDNGIAASYINTQTVALTTITTHTKAAPTTGTPITISWTAVDGASTYNIYREINGVFGYVGTAISVSFVDLGYSVDPLDTPPVPLDYFNAAGKYPKACGYYQQRRVLGGPTGDPEEVRASRTGLFDNFTRSNPTQADDSIRWITVSEKLNAVRHFADMGKLLMFTQGAVFSAEGDDSGTLTPTAINPRKRADHGVGDIPPIPAGSVVLYVQTSGKIVREIEPNGLDRYATRDLTSFVKHLFESYGITAWAYAEEPFGILWAVRADGTLLGLTYLKEHAVDGWHHHDTGDGDEFLDVSTIPENNETATYVLVRRYDCNGHTRVYCERMASRTVLTPREGRFLDSFGVLDGTNTDAGNTYVLHYDTAHSAEPRYWIEPTGGTAPWIETPPSPDVGNAVVFLLEDGTELRATVTEVDSQFVAFVTVEGDTSGLTLPYSTADWALAVDVIGGLWHLNGREVMVLGDGETLGPFTVADGAITLPVACYQVVGGLQIIADLETLEPDNPAGETWADKTKSMAEITLKVRNTLGIQVGLGNTAAEFQPMLPRWCNPKKYVEGALYTGKLQVLCRGQVTDDGIVFVRQSSPLPATVLGIYPRLQIGEV